MIRNKHLYENMDEVNTTKSMAELRQWQKERRTKKKDLSYRIPQAERKEIGWLKQNRHQSSVTWIGHSTFLIQTAGLNLITDPVWANRMGFDKRKTRPGLAISDLPDIDLVLISHNHYDHLHIASLRNLPGKPSLLVPAGLGSLLHRKGFERVVEFDWWDEKRIGDASLAFVPAQHWSRRSLWDTNRSHWGGWIVRNVRESENEWTIYFAGDSGYFRGFREIGARFRIKVALMPIGAYEPEWFMAAQHVTPEEAVRAFLDTEAETFIPMHYGAFRLADDTAKEALDRLYPAWDENGLDRGRLLVLKLGETRKF